MSGNKKDESTECNWCEGSGDFYDFDSNYGYGIPVCGGCGGLGRVPIEEDPDFKSKTRIIQALRHEYCPVDGRSFFKMHPVHLLNILEELIEKITIHFNEYGTETDESYAKMVTERSLQTFVNKYKNEISNNVLQLKDMAHNQHSYFNKQMVEIELAIWQGTEFTEVEKIFQNLMEEYSTLSEFHFFHANFLISFSHFESAIPVLEKAMEFETETKAKTSILYALARCLYIINRDEEAVQTAHKALGTCDPDSALWEELVKFIKRTK